jgi:hypothetical protein
MYRLRLALFMARRYARLSHAQPIELSRRLRVTNDASLIPYSGWHIEKQLVCLGVGRFDIVDFARRFCARLQAKRLEKSVNIGVPPRDASHTVNPLPT